MAFKCEPKHPHFKSDQHFFFLKKDENDLIGMRETRGKLANILLGSFRNHEKYKSLSVTFNNII